MIRQLNLFADLQIQDLIKDGYLFVINHSAGKDSQAMTIKLKELVPADQLLVVHAHLDGVEWGGVKEHIRDTIGNLPLIIAHPRKKDGSRKTFFSMVRDRHQKLINDQKDASPWPSPQYRQCTSDLKSGPINREIRQFLKENPRFKNKVVNCIGIRAEESSNRAKKKPLFRCKKNSLDNKKNPAKNRDWWEWYPIFNMSTKEVFKTISKANQQPHWAYKEGMGRLSCVFCIMSSDADLRTAARLNPDLLEEYSQLEEETGKTMMMPRKGVTRTLKEIIYPIPDQKAA